jgi:hypothetical protein
MCFGGFVFVTPPPLQKPIQIGKNNFPRQAIQEPPLFFFSVANEDFEGGGDGRGYIYIYIYIYGRGCGVRHFFGLTDLHEVGCFVTRGPIQLRTSSSTRLSFCTEMTTRNNVQGIIFAKTKALMYFGSVLS